MTCRATQTQWQDWVKRKRRHTRLDYTLILYRHLQGLKASTTQRARMKRGQRPANRGATIRCKGSTGWCVLRTTVPTIAAASRHEIRHGKAVGSVDREFDLAPLRRPVSRPEKSLLPIAMRPGLPYFGLAGHCTTRSGGSSQSWGVFQGRTPSPSPLSRPETRGMKTPANRRIGMT